MKSYLADAIENKYYNILYSNLLTVDENIMFEKIEEKTIFENLCEDEQILKKLIDNYKDMYCLSLQKYESKELFNKIEEMFTNKELWNEVRTVILT
jgi:hypothetical protein